MFTETEYLPPSSLIAPKRGETEKNKGRKSERKPHIVVPMYGEASIEKCRYQQVLTHLAFSLEPMAMGK